jgi:hypothetical protein
MASTAFAQKNTGSPTAAKMPVTYGSSNIKLMPAINVNTYAISYEQPISDRISLELMGGYKFASTQDNDNPAKNSQNKAGYLVDLSGKYYFGTAPTGWYVMATVGASNIIYRNSTVRPYSFSGGTKKSSEVTGKENYTSDPSALRYGIGTGYQFAIISRKLIANLGVSVGGYSNSDGTQVHVYFTPSVGYSF